MGSAATAERRRVEAVVETLAAIHRRGDSLGELAHDARNMVTALSLYCDLLEEPGVLPAAHRHYGSELRLVAEASRRLVEKLALLGDREEEGCMDPRDSYMQGSLFPEAGSPEAARITRSAAAPLSMGGGQVARVPAGDSLIDNLQAEVLASRNLLAAIAGPSVNLTVNARGGSVPVRMTSEDLIRALVNLVKNAAESIPEAGSIRIDVIDRPDNAAEVPTVVLVVEDSGSGIPCEQLDRVFEPGYTTRWAGPSARRWESGGHRGLGLAITRSIVETAGGRIRAESGTDPGARFVIELPVGHPESSPGSDLGSDTGFRRAPNLRANAIQDRS
jgi:signal transduction histidine kinase